MNYRNLIHALDILKKRLKNVIENDAQLAIERAIADLKDSKTNYDKYRRRKNMADKGVKEWGYEILNPSLRFKIAGSNGFCGCGSCDQKLGSAIILMAKS